MSKNQGLSKEMKLLVAKQQHIFRSMQILYDMTLEIKTSHTISPAFRARYSQIGTIKEEFMLNFEHISKQTLIEDPETEIDSQVLKTFDELYYNVIAVVQEYSSAPAGSAAPVSGGCEVQPQTQVCQPRYPKLELPKFCGKIENWSTFYDSFLSMVHKKTSLSSIEKFHYLVSSLSGSALSLIKGIPINDSNYQIAFNALTERYQNKRILAAVYLEKIITLVPPAVPSLANLSRFTDVLYENFNSLKALELNDLSDFILFHLTARALDADTRKRFETQNSKQIPSFEELLRFLLNYIKILETCGPDACAPGSYRYSPARRVQGRFHALTPDSGASGGRPAVRWPAIKQSFVVSENTLKEPADESLMSSEYEVEEAELSQPLEVFGETGTRQPVCQSLVVSQNGREPACLFCNEVSHTIHRCPTFQSTDVMSRLEFIKSNRYCINCLRKGHLLQSCFTKTNCSLCNGRHNTLLHVECSPPAAPLPGTGAAVVGAPSHALVGESRSRAVLLGTAVLHVCDASGTYQPVRALIDSCAQDSFLTTACARRLGLRTINCKLSVAGIGDRVVEVKGTTSCQLKPRQADSPTFQINTVVLDKISSPMPNVPISSTLREHFKHLELADHAFDKCSNIELLIGAELFDQIYDGQRYSPGPGIPTALHSVFGWVISGKVGTNYNSPPLVSSLVTSTKVLERALKAFWEIEEPPEVQRTSTEDVICENRYSELTYRNEDGRYVVPLMLRADGTGELGDAYSHGISRFINLERRLARNLQLRSDYSKFMAEYNSLGHMHQVEFNPGSNNIIIPHHCVIKPSSSTTKLRVVFDASAKTTSNKSLNDIVYAGPKLQTDIVDILLKFRTHRVVFTADVCKMYRQILIRPEDRKFQHILWRNSSAEPMREYELDTVTYGVASSPYLAIRTLRRLAEDEGEGCPRARQVICEECFMDDICTGAPSVQSAIKLKDEVTALLAKGKFQLRKFSSNDADFLSSVPAEHCELPKEFVDEENENYLKILGVQWHPRGDYFSYSIGNLSSSPTTKRTILSQIARLYDPLGYINPVIFTAKFLLQELWRLGLGWDDPVPEHVENSWLKFVAQLECLSSLKLQRLILPQNCNETQLVGFCDASTKGYGACVYLRASNNKHILVSLLLAKSKVAPLKTLTTNRLELCSAVLLSRLLTHVQKVLAPLIKLDSIIAFSDSTTVLAWLRTETCKLKIFVANRVVKINDMIDQSCWRFVCTQDNAADCCSRGLSASEIVSHPLWWRGPRWLQSPMKEWPRGQVEIALDNESNASECCEFKRSVVSQNYVQANHAELITDLVGRFSSLSRLRRVVAWCRRFISNFQAKHVGNATGRFEGYLSVGELRESDIIIFNHIQDEDFATERNLVRQKKNCRPEIQKLSPFLDENGLLRVGGRIRNADLPYDNRHPILISKRNRLAGLIIDDLHKRYLHCGPRTLQSLIQRRFWIIGVRNAIRSRLSKCVVCFRVAPRPCQPVMGDLPSCRVRQGRCFQHVGIDLGGPFIVKESRRRNARTYKTYLCLFVCLSVKAVHLESVTELSCDAFLAALDRFVARRETNDQSIELTRIKREGVPENRDLTVLLLNDKKRQDYNTKTSHHGRYHSVKPVIGLLTSTARTFIQDGVTTEFATQILGTTLDNGRIYAQLLTKTSLVLYSKPTNDDIVSVKPTRVPSIFDEQWNVKEDLGFIDPDKFVVKNTDYLAPNKNFAVVNKPTLDHVKYWNTQVYSVDNNIPDEPTARKAPRSQAPQYVKNEALNLIDNPSHNTNKKFIVQPLVSSDFNTVGRQNKAYLPIVEPVFEANDEKVEEINIVKVKNTYDVPTFTIKNEFSPVLYYIDNVEPLREKPSGEQTKLPKKLFGQNNEPRPKKTFTYAGFADFTTVVGDTVIIFTPNTETTPKPNPDEVNVFPSAKRVDQLATKITTLAADIPVATSTYNAYGANIETKLPSPVYENNVSEKDLSNNKEDINKDLSHVNDKIPDVISVQHNTDFGFNLDVIQASEPVYTTMESTHVTEDLGVLPINNYSPQATEPLTLDPTTTIIDTHKETAVTEKEVYEIFTKSAEEIDSVGAEVTASNGDNQGDKSKLTTEMIAENPTTENSSNEESHEPEKVVTTPETKHDTHEEVFCTNGLDTLVITTTEYKTLTYLTTYFIPLEDIDSTSTSIKSDVVVESHVGYTSDIICKTDLYIEPTEVLSVNIQSSIHSSLDQSILEDTVTGPPLRSDIVTEDAPKTTPTEKTTSQEIRDTTLSNTTPHTPEVVEDKEPTTPVTTTDSAITSNSHVEISVSTEHSSPATEKPITEEKVENSQENEIDIIYKTLYTTYTYFTTFFGEQTSSIASNKVIETNIITSTIDLSKLDPSLLGALSDQEIAPTNVGIGRPTVAFAENSIGNLLKNKFLIESVEQEQSYSSQTPTPSLGEDIIASIKPDAVKTYFTTYTFFTTIYVGTDANVCSRSEVYTNYVGPDDLIPTKINPLVTGNTKAQYDFRNCRQVKLDQTDIPDTIKTAPDQNDGQNPSPQPSSVEVDMLFSVESNPLISENAYVTDISSSSSRGERKLIDNNNILDDQISSESNVEEILPSPTLLLQTSYTTFTYFTTMYIGKDSTNVKSHLETITNVVTETITPNKEVEETSLPITYYTTFTYWTTLSKDNATTITSREEVVSNVVTPGVSVLPTVAVIDTSPIDGENLLPPTFPVHHENPIDTTPIDLSLSQIPLKHLDVQLKPSVFDDNSEHGDGKATFYTTYTYFTTFYVANTSHIRSRLETVTNIVDNTKVIEENQLGRKVQSGPAEQNLVQDDGKKANIAPTIVKEPITTTKLPDLVSASPTVLLGTHIDNLFTEIKPVENNIPTPDTQKKIVLSQVAVISGDSTVITSDNMTSNTLTTEASSAITTTTTTENSIISPTPDVIESSVGEPDTETEPQIESQQDSKEEDSTNTRKKSRLTYPSKTSPFTPFIRPFASKYRPIYSPKRIPPATGSATTITRTDTTPTITATPTLKSVRPSSFGSNKKQPQITSSVSSRSGNRFSGRGSVSSLSSNLPVASKSGGFGNRGVSIQATSKRTGFRTSSVRSNSLESASRLASPRIRPTVSSRLRSNKQTASVTFPPSDQNESETFSTQQEESVTESLDESTEVPPKTTTPNPLLKFRRPPITRQPGTGLPSRSSTPSTKRATTPRGRITSTTTKRITTRSLNPLLALRRGRPNNLFPKRNLFKQSEPEPEEIKENEAQDEDNEEILEAEDFNEDTDYDASNRKERQIAPTSPPIRRSNPIQIRPFRRRSKRQVDYGSRKFSNFRRPGTVNTRKVEPEPEVETEKPAPAPTSSSTKNSKHRTGSRSNSRTANHVKTTTSAPTTKASRQPFIVRGESKTTTSASAYRRNKSSSPSRTAARTTTTAASKLKSPRLSSKNIQSRPSTSRSTTSRSSRTRTTTGRSSNRHRGSFENTSGERLHNYNNIIDDGKITITYHIPVEVTVPVVNGRITEYKNLLTSTTKIETLFENQVSTSIGPLGKHQLLLATESTELADNGATKVIKYLLQETPTTTVIFTPTTIRGRKTSYSHIIPSTVYDVESVTSTIAPEINANLPLANLLLSQLLLGNQQPGLNGVNPLLALQGQNLLPQQPVVQTPVTELKTRTTTYVTTVTDARETVLPITFRGRAILTTIVDPTTTVITATEFLTDTVVTTPTVFAPVPSPQLNSLLLPFLLQQQQQQQQGQQQLFNLPLQTPNPLLGLGHPDLSLDQNHLLNNDILSNHLKSDLVSNEDLNEFQSSSEEDEEEPSPTPPPTTPPPTPRHSRGRSRTNKPNTHHKQSGGTSPQSPPPPTAPTPQAPPQAPSPPAPSKITSIVTLYVSGRHPGEFSTVLSTLITEDTHTVRKRDVDYFDDVQVLPSVLPSHELNSSEMDNSAENSILAVSQEHWNEIPVENQFETQSLESIVGELSKHISYDTSPTYIVKLTRPSATSYIKQSFVDDIS